MAGVFALSSATAYLSLAPAADGKRKATKSRTITKSEQGRNSQILSQSSCCSSNYSRVTGRERALHLTMPSSILVNFGHRASSGRLAMPYSGVSERISSSKFCSSSSFERNQNKNSRSEFGGFGVYVGMSKARSKKKLPENIFERNTHKNSWSEFGGFGVYVGMSKTRSKKKLSENITRFIFSGSQLDKWSRRRGIDFGVARSQHSQSENLDIGDLKFDPRAEINEGEASVQDSLELNDLAKKLVGTSAGAKNDVDFTQAQSWFERIPKRWVVVILCFFAFLLCNMDRVNMSIAILPMSAEYGWSPTTVGLVQSSFFWGYLLTQIAGGVWADKIGGKQVLGFGVVWWSLATVATPIAAKVGLPALFFVRACMGVGEGVAMPAMNNLLSKWIPVQERSRSLALVYSGMYLGSVIGLACSPSLIHSFGWPSVFFSFGSVGAIWFVLWQRLAFSSPGDHPTISEDESILILKSNKPRDPIEKIPWGLILSKAPVWALIVCHFCHNWGTFILLTWMPTYYNQVLGFNLMESGLFSVLPWLTMAFSANLGGWIADSLVSKGWSVTLVRKVMQSVGFLGPAFFLTQLSHITSPSVAVLCMMCSQGLDAFSQAGLYSNHQDIGPRYSGILLGLSNTAGVLAGVLGTAATGYILQHGSWDDVFKVAVGLYLFGTVVWNVFATGEKQFD